MIDENDNIPLFPRKFKPPYLVDALENEPGPRIITDADTKLIAIDKDENSDICYFISSEFK